MEVELYHKLLPPGFRWVSTSIPRAMVWSVILMLAPVTIAYYVVKAIVNRR